MAIIDKSKGATTKIDLIDLKTGLPLVLGWMDDITDFHFGFPMYLQVHGQIQNTNTDSTVPDDVIPPIATMKTLAGAKLIYQKVTATSNKSETDYWFGYVPNQDAAVGFQTPSLNPLPDIPIFGNIGWANLEFAIRAWAEFNFFGAADWNMAKVVQRFINTGQNQMSPRNPAGNLGGPIIAFECNPAMGTAAIRWSDVSTKSPTVALTQARAKFWIDFLIANQPTESQFKGPPNPFFIQYFAPGPAATEQKAYAYFRTKAISYTYFWKVKNDKTEDMASVTLGGSNGGSMSLNADIYTTGNLLGSINITGKQVAQIAKFMDPALLNTINITQDTSTGLGNPDLTNGTYKFGTFRDPVKPPHLLYEGAHINATKPIPSV